MKLFGKKKLFLFLLWSLCSSGQEKVVIFSINDMHSRIENFSKIKPLIDKEKRMGNKVFFVSARCSHVRSWRKSNGFKSK